MALWGCQVGSGFLNCANSMYSESERMLLGATVMAVIALASWAVIHLTSAR